MTAPFLSRYQYGFLFFLLGAVCAIGLFVPLMDNDSAHHANIALHMHLTGDYVSLIDNGKDYLDKPHFHFWLAALSYKIFGVSGFAYKLPSFLFTCLGLYSTFQLGKRLYHAETGRLAALITGSSFAFLLANNDVRMDAILTACIVFATWQLTALVQTKRAIYAFGAALGLAMAFSTKGHIGLILPGAGILFYIAGRNEWRIFLHRNWWLTGIVFLILILPEIWCYYLQFNLHPEKTVRGKDQINGVQFILYGQSIERFRGEQFGSVNGNDHFFFFHTFLWAFAPWSILAGWAIVERIRHWKNKQAEWLTTGSFITLALIISFSGFKLPHYLNVIFPSTAIAVAAFLLDKKNSPRRKQILFAIQAVVSLLLLCLAGLVLLWVFPDVKTMVIAGIILFLSLVFYYLQHASLQRLQKAVTVPVAVMLLVFFCLNTHFYPRLLRYQGGNELAAMTKGKADPARVFNWKEEYSSSYNFYSRQLTGRFHDSLLNKKENCWLLYDEEFLPQIEAAGYRVNPVYSVPAYRVTRLDFSFLDPHTRDTACSRLVMATLSRR